MSVEVFVPKMSDHMAVGIIIEWLAKEGDQVERGQPILELETDKATVELEAPDSGILKGIRAGVGPGANVPVGETIAYIVKSPDEAVPALAPLGRAESEPDERPVEESPTPPTETAEVPAEEGGPVRAVPAVRRIARELGVDLRQVKGTGPGSRILESDLRAFAAAQEQAKPAPQPVAAPEMPGAVMITPVARRMAEKLGVDPAQVTPATVPGRITKEDIQAYVESAHEPPPASPPAEPSEWVDLTRAQLMTGQRMTESMQNAPQFALTTTVDMTRALELREAVLASIEAETGVRPSLTTILIKAVADALKHYPRANASFVDGRIKLHQEVNIGVAVGSDEGLLVPVIHGADRLGLADITRELKSLQEKAGRMRFGPNDLSGGTFTLSNLGMFGIDHFHAIINPPESAILAVGRIVKTPVGMRDDTIALRPMMHMTLSIDHRSLDGMQGAEFLALVKERLEQPYLML
jgi:pyruvate dehydrogenase E2 component (dihydrolipoamide acetyltransferase)